MPIPKKGTPEAKAWGAKMRAAKVAKDDGKPAPVDHGSPMPSDYSDLFQQVQELKAYLFDQGQTRAQTVTPTRTGLVGTFEKYITDPAHYPDPRERLANEQRLQRFAFSMNYELEWDVSTTSYQTKDGVNTKEPKFQLQLNQIVMDDAGEPTVGRIIVTQGIFFEDPEAALVVAKEQGIEVDEADEKRFLDEMRYLRFRDWLLEAFFTPLPITESTSKKKEMVVAGKLVQYFEVNSEKGSQVPFSELNTRF